jgi:hypothetical protein
MQVFNEDMKLPAMQVIQAATKWPAETMRVQNQIGTVEVGKLADLLIVDNDPLQDIANLQKIAVVIANGRIEPRGFQPLKVTGIGYFARSVVYFNGIPVPTRVLNGNEIQAQIDESLLRAPGRYAVVVRNMGLADPQKVGDGSSNRGWLIVGYR